MTQRKTSQLDLVIKSLSMKQNGLKNQILQVNVAIEKKNKSINTFRDYAEAYDIKNGSSLLHTVQIVKNNQAFYEQLARVMAIEQTELDKLEALKRELITNYHTLSTQHDGMEVLRDELRMQQAQQRDKREESELADTLLTREDAWSR